MKKVIHSSLLCNFLREYGIILRRREQVIPKWDYFFRKISIFHMRTRTLAILLIISIIVIVCISAFYGWFLIKSDRIATGTAKPYFPYSDYSIDELNKMYPQTMNENVVTTQTPEQTHSKFIAALKQGDFDEAVKCCFLESDWVKMKTGLEKVKEKGNLDIMIGDLTLIKQQTMFDTMATYNYDVTTHMKGTKGVGSIDFVKDEKGVWRIKSL